MLQQRNDFEDLREELVALGYTGEHRDDESVIQGLVAVHLTLETLDVSEAAREAILDLLSATGRQDIASLPDLSEESWQSFDYGNVKLFDLVRIKHDAYDSDTGVKHNGLVGILTDMRGGQCTVKYLGLASRSSQRHPMEKLDSLKGVYNRRPSQNT
jgi:hypothetical protein